MTPDRQGAMLIAACAVVLIFALGGAAIVESWQRQAEDQLRRDSPCAGHVSVLLDLSDPPTLDQAAALGDRLLEVAETKLRPGDVVTVWTLGRSAEGPLHRALRLHCPSRRSNPLYQNARRMLERYDSLFTRPLHHLLVQLPASRPARWSPILESISALAELPELRGNGPRRLLVVSDLQQHTAAISFCARQQSFATFRSSPLASQLRPDLRGVAVEVLLIPRARQELSVELARQRFWRSYFVTAGAQSVEFERL